MKYLRKEKTSRIVISLVFVRRVRFDLEGKKVDEGWNRTSTLSLAFSSSHKSLDEDVNEYLSFLGRGAGQTRRATKGGPMLVSFRASGES